MNPLKKMLLAFKRSVMLSSRKAKLDHFYGLHTQSPVRVLDVGISPETVHVDHSSARNFFAKNFRYPSPYYCGLAVQDISGISGVLPEKTFVRYGGSIFPFRDKAFAWCFSNAVIEHVGDFDRQVHFLNEMMRVADSVFFTTPNKFFPMESHTNVFFRHWFDGGFFRWCSRHAPEFTPDNLVLLSGKSLEKVLQASNAKSYTITRNRLFGLVMTYSVVCRG